MMKVRANHVEHSVLFDDDGLNKPGDYNFYSSKGRDIAGMNYICPCGCGDMGSLAFRPHPSPSWKWNGDQATPTLNPSVRKLSGCLWHGFLTKGFWVQA